MSLYISVLVLLLVPVIWFGIPVAYRNRGERRLRRACAARGAIALTFDDGPSDDVTWRVMDLLAARGAVATFFVIGYKVQGNVEVVTALDMKGHDIGNHTQRHGNAWKIGPLSGMKDMLSGQRTLEMRGVRSGLFRPPYGKATLGTLCLAFIKSVRFAYWTIDSQDSWNRRSIDGVLAELENKGGGVLLMHDFSHPARGPYPDFHKEYVLTLTERVMDLAERKGFQIVSVSDLLEERKN